MAAFTRGTAPPNMLQEFVIHNWYLFAALAAVLAMLLIDPALRLLYQVRHVDPNGAVRLMNRESGVIVDVCEPQEFQAGHIPRALNVPLGALGQRFKELEKYRDRPVIVSCRTGNRSLKGAMILRKHGFSTVYSLAGGMQAWERDNLPTSTK